MSFTLRLLDEHLRRFADASGDQNPLHVDQLYARHTPHGRCVAQGALVTIAALGAADPAALRAARTIDLKFRRPVFPDEDHSVALVASDGDRTRIEVAAGQVAASVVVRSDPGGGDLTLPEDVDGAAVGESAARHQTIDELVHPGLSLSEPYACDLAMLRALAADLGAAQVPDGILVWLAAASYTVGMLVPGRDALFVGAKLARSTSPGAGGLTASVALADDRTGLVMVDAVLERGASSAQMTLQTFLRSPVPRPDRATVSRYLLPSAELEGRKILVVGGSRGLGASLSGAFATQGATVWAGFAESAEQAAELRDEFGGERLRLLEFDASSPEQARGAFDVLRTEAGALDGVVLCAAPALYETAVHPDAIDGTLRFLGASMAMALVPLAEAVQLLAPDAWLVVVSSSALDDPPEGWPQYLIAKAALEGAAGYCSRHTGARVLVVRAPLMLSDSTNTPLARVDAVPTERVAAGIARWVMEPPDEHGELSVLGPDDLLGDSP